MMNENDQRIAIAEECGIVIGNHNNPNWTDGCSVPDYLHDLNAMHGVEKVLFDRNDWSASRYEETLQKMTTSWAWHSTAAQRAEAFLRTIGKWKE